MSLYLARTFNEEGERFWVLFDDAGRVVRGKIGESRNGLLFRWNYPRGSDKITDRYSGVMRPSELAMTLGHIKQKLVNAATEAT